MHSRSLTASEKEWLDVRRYLERSRFELGVEAAGGYDGHTKVFDTPLLSRTDWLPATPIGLADIELHVVDGYPVPRSSADYGAALPFSPTGTRYENYTDAYQRLAAPRVLENRETYRLTAADLVASPGRLTFGRGHYFDSLNTGEASAHAYAAERLGHDAGSIRVNIADPCDLSKRPVNVAVSALTLRYNESTGEADFFLHWRDPKKVGHAGGLFQVVPSGVFQASGGGPWNHPNDFSLIRFLTREFSEELGGKAEEYENASHGIDYAGWPFARDLQAHLDSGHAQAWCVGMGVDPLTFATDLLAVVVFESGAFNELFGEVVADNDEGQVTAAKPFVESEIRQLVEHERMQAAGAALLAGAWHHRTSMLPMKAR